MIWNISYVTYVNFAHLSQTDFRKIHPYLVSWMRFPDIGLAHAAKKPGSKNELNRLISNHKESTKKHFESFRRRNSTQRRWFVLFLALVLHENRVIYSCSEWVTNLSFRKYLIYCYAKSIFCFNRKKTFEKRFIILQKKTFFHFQKRFRISESRWMVFEQKIARHQRTGPFRRSRPVRCLTSERTVFRCFKLWLKQIV